jgi:hypothetical protein
MIRSIYWVRAWGLIGMGLFLSQTADAQLAGRESLSDALLPIEPHFPEQRLPGSGTIPSAAAIAALWKKSHHFPCYVAYIHGSGSQLQNAEIHEGFGVPGDSIEQQWTPDNSTINSFTYYSSRQYDPDSACAIYRVGYNGLSAWYADDAAGQVATQINQFIDEYAIPDSELIIITHSMGGVLGRWILNNGVATAPYYNYSGQDYERIAQKTKYMITIQAPHWGSQVADAIYGQADNYFSDAAGAIAVEFAGQDQSEARNSIRREYMRDATLWLGDAGRYRTLYTVAGESVDDDAGEGMENDGQLQTAWAGVCYRRAWFNGWGSLCNLSDIAFLGAVGAAVGAATFDNVAGDGLVERLSAAGQRYIVPASTSIHRGRPPGIGTSPDAPPRPPQPVLSSIEGAYRHWLDIHDNHNQGRFDMHYAPITDNVSGTQTSNYPGSYIGSYGLALE